MILTDKQTNIHTDEQTHRQTQHISVSLSLLDIKVLYYGGHFKLPFHSGSLSWGIRKKKSKDFFFSLINIRKIRFSL